MNKQENADARHWEMKPCRRCGEEIVETSSKCPACGLDAPRHIRIASVGIAAIGLGVAAFTSGVLEVLGLAVILLAVTQFFILAQYATATQNYGSRE